MADYIPVKIPGDETHRLADLSGVVHDLHVVSALCARLLRRMAEDPRGQDLTEIEALQAAAVVRYCRTFAGGVRTAFKLTNEMLHKLSEELQRTHREFDDLRDKHIAHSVNDWELNVPVVYLKRDAASGKCDVSSVSVQRHRIVALSEASIEQLQRLAGTLQAMVEEELVKEKARVFEIVKGMPIDELEKGMNDPAHVPGVGKLDQRRSR